jgi:hypothetical protein
VKQVGEARPIPSALSLTQHEDKEGVIKQEQQDIRKTECRNQQQRSAGSKHQQKKLIVTQEEQEESNIEHDDTI